MLRYRHSYSFTIFQFQYIPSSVFIFRQIFFTELEAQLCASQKPNAVFHISVKIFYISLFRSFPQFVTVKHSKFRIRGMVHHQRLAVPVHHLAVPKPALELRRFSLFHKFPVDRGIIF